MMDLIARAGPRVADICEDREGRVVLPSEKKKGDQSGRQKKIASHADCRSDNYY